MTAFAYAGNYDLTFAGEDEIDSLVEIFVELGDEIKQGLSLILETLYCG